MEINQVVKLIVATLLFNQLDIESIMQTYSSELQILWSRIYKTIISYLGEIHVQVGQMWVLLLKDK